MRSHSGVASKMFQALGSANINIQMITTSEIKISVIINEESLEDGIYAVHTAFELDKQPSESKQLFMEV
jgi:aspartate kinase